LKARVSGAGHRLVLSSSSVPAPTPRFTSSPAYSAIRLLTAAALGLDAYVHATNASFYDPAQGGFITEGNLFRAEALVAGLVALAILVRPTLAAWAAALLVAASALAAVVLYRYVNVGPLGPIPNLYEPTWQSPGKLLSAYAEGSAVVLASVGLLRISAGRR
jgi:hypothetical protein